MTHRVRTAQFPAGARPVTDKHQVMPPSRVSGYRQPGMLQGNSAFQPGPTGEMQRESEDSDD